MTINAEERWLLANRLLQSACELSHAMLEYAKSQGILDAVRDKADGVMRLMSECEKALYEGSFFESTPLWLTHIKIGGQPPDKLTEWGTPSPLQMLLGLSASNCKQQCMREPRVKCTVCGRHLHAVNMLIHLKQHKWPAWRITMEHWLYSEELEAPSNMIS